MIKQKFILSLVLPALISGCTPGFDWVTGSQTDTTTTADKIAPEPLQSKVYLIGQLNGVLKDALAAALVNLVNYNGISADAPILIMGNQVATLTDQQKTGILAAYQAKYPIGLLWATADQINLFHMVLAGSPFIFTMPADSTLVEAYAVDLEAGNNTYQWVLYPPLAADTYEDTSDFQQTRANLLAKWLGKNGYRTTVSAAVRAKIAACNKNSSPVNTLADYASAYTVVSNFSYQGDLYQLAHTIYSCRSLNTDPTQCYDWFYVSQGCSFNSSGAYRGRIPNYVPPDNGGYQSWGDWVGLYARNFTLDAQVQGYTNNMNNVILMTSGPPTPNGTTEVTNGIDYEIGGDFGVSGKEGPELKISGGITISDETTTTIDDCTVTNNSCNQGNNAHWSFDFKGCDKVPYFFYTGVTDPPAIATSDFLQVNEWIWRLAPTVRNEAPTLDMTVTFNATLVDTWGYTNFFWSGWLNEDLYNSPTQTLTVNLPYAPIPTTQPSQ
jgi:hypothetical protein